MHFWIFLFIIILGIIIITPIVIRIDKRRTVEYVNSTIQKDSTIDEKSAEVVEKEWKTLKGFKKGGTKTINLRGLKDDIEKEVIKKTLERTGHNVRAASSVLGIDRKRLLNKLKKYELK